MEKIKLFILDFIFSSFESFASLLSSLLAFDALKFKQTCYAIPAMDYIGIIILICICCKLLILAKRWVGARL